MEKCYYKDIFLYLSSCFKSNFSFSYISFAEVVQLHVADQLFAFR